MKRIWISCFVALFFAGCVSEKSLRVVKGEWDKPYVSLGDIEVKVEAAQLKTRHRKEKKSYKEMLHEELTAKALPLGAEGLARVRYWPDLSSRSFPDGFAYARAEMIRYERFPAKPEKPAKPS